MEKIKRFIMGKKMWLQLVSLILLFAFLIAAMFAFMNRNNSLGWFSQNREVEASGASVALYRDDYPDLNAWIFDLTSKIGVGEGYVAADEDENGDTIDKSGSWANAIDDTTLTDPKGILPVVAYEGNAHDEHLYFSSLHLGTVDNLLTLSNDNCFYLRFDVTDAHLEDFSHVHVGYSLQTSGIKVYNMSGADKTDEIAALTDSEDNNLNVLQKCVDIFRVDAAVSGTEFEPGALYNRDTGDAIVGEPGEGVTTAAGEKMIDALFSDPLVNGSTVDLGQQDEAYFIYVRFSPNLANCFEATDHIATYMPCEITFDVTLSLLFE